MPTLADVVLVQQQPNFARCLTCTARHPQPFTNGSPARGGGEVTIDATEMDGRYTSTDYYKHTDETRAFQQASGGADLGAGSRPWFGAVSRQSGALCTSSSAALPAVRRSLCKPVLNAPALLWPATWAEPVGAWLRAGVGRGQGAAGPAAGEH